MYTIKQEATLREMYANDETPLAIGVALGKTARSVISKLSSLNIYVPKGKVSKVTGETPKPKSEYVAEICALLGADALPSLERATKPTLLAMLEAVKALKATENDS